jgi:hypothetical protein
MQLSGGANHSRFSTLIYLTNSTETFNRPESPLPSIPFRLEKHASTGYRIIEAEQKFPVHSPIIIAFLEAGQYFLPHFSYAVLLLSVCLGLYASHAHTGICR